MAIRQGRKTQSSFVGGKALRAQIDIWQEGHADSIRTECGLDTMSDVNLAVIELLHDVHEITLDSVRSGGGRAKFTREGTLKVLQNDEVVCIPALVATASQLPHPVKCCLACPVWIA